MNKTLYQAIRDAYTDYLRDVFSSFIEEKLFDGKSFLDYFEVAVPDSNRLSRFNIQPIVFERLLGALVSVNAVKIANGQLIKGTVISSATPISSIAKCLDDSEDLSAQIILFNEQFLAHKYVLDQLHKAGSLASYLKNSIAYDMLIVKKFLTPKSTFKALTTGSSIVSEIFGLSTDQIFDHYRSRPELLRLFGLGFASSHLISDLEFIDKIDFNNGDEVVDIGGCFGGFGNLVLSNSKNEIIYKCLDLKEILHSFEADIQEFKSRFGSRYDFIPGDFFDDENQVTGLESQLFDKIILGWILHDWNDNQCVEILKKSSMHLKKNAAIYIFEVLPNERKMSFNFTDWLMLAMANGFERTHFQYNALIEKAGLQLEETYKTKSGRSLMKVVEKV